MLLFKVSSLSVDTSTLSDLAEIACCDTIFSTHDGFYIQKEGLAMGCPPAPHLANGWLSGFDKIIQGDSLLYERYIDDIICIVKKTEIDNRLATIQGLHHCLSFTHELESNGKLPFLDMMINNVNGKLSSSWYRKPTATDLTLNFHDLAPLKYKRSVVSKFCVQDL